MMKKIVTTLVVASAASAVVLACSSSDSNSSSSSSSSTSSGGSSGGSSSSSGGGSCSIKKDSVKCVSVTKKSGDQLCPDIKCDQFASNGDVGAGDGGSSKCDPVVNEAACTIKIDCTESEGGTTSTTKGDFKAEGGQVKGTLTVTVTGAVSLSCTYDMVFQ